MEELYVNIFDMEGVAQHPAYHGFSYGVLFVDEGRPAACFYVDETADRKLQYILTSGKFEIHALGQRRAEIYYGYVTDGERFFAEEQIYPRDDQSEGDFL